MPLPASIPRPPTRRSGHRQWPSPTFETRTAIWSAPVHRRLVASIAMVGPCRGDVVRRDDHGRPLLAAGERVLGPTPSHRARRGSGRRRAGTHRPGQHYGVAGLKVIERALHRRSVVHGAVPDRAIGTGSIRRGWSAAQPPTRAAASTSSTTERPIITVHGDAGTPGLLRRHTEPHADPLDPDCRTHRGPCRRLFGRNDDRCRKRRQCPDRVCARQTDAQVNGLPVRIVVPKSATVPAPAVMVLHGGGEDGPKVQTQSEMDAKRGSRDSSPPTRVPLKASGTTPGGVAQLNGIADSLNCVDGQRLYLAGFSRDH